MKRAQGSFGSRHGQPWSHSLAAATRRGERSGGAAGTAEPTARIEPHVLREAIGAQVCPWCGNGPYSVLAGHTHKAHGVSAAELRQLADLSTKASICSPDYSDDSRERLITRPDFEEVQVRATAAAVASGAQHRAVEESVRRTRDANAEKYDQAVHLFRSGKSIEDIAEVVGLATKTVSENLKRLGCDVDGYVSRQRARRLRSDAMVAAAASARADAATRLWEKRESRFLALGSDWAAVCRLSDEEGVDRKTMVAGLKQRGVAVPDGRQVTPLRGRAGGRVYATKPKQACSDEECSRDAVIRGMCRMHYRRWNTENGRPCSVEGCTKGVVGRGLCGAHYAAARQAAK